MGESTYGLAGLMTAGSGGRVNTSGRVGHEPLVELVVAGHEHGQRLLLASRPARPACCQSEAMVPGKPLSTQASRPPMSTPSSSAVVATTPRSRPANSSASISRRSAAR